MPPERFKMYYIEIKENNEIIFTTIDDTPKKVWGTMEWYKPESTMTLEYGFKDKYGITVLMTENGDDWRYHRQPNKKLHSGFYHK